MSRVRALPRKAGNPSGMWSWLLALEVVSPIVVLLLQRWRRRPFPTEHVVTLPALLAPLALLCPWAAVPDHLGVGFGGPRLFIHWLTKYPNAGPINAEVLAGILCVLGAAVAPLALGIYRLAGGARRSVALSLALATLVAYVPVLLRLDVDLVRFGLLGAPSLVGPVESHEALGGPLVRGLAALASVVVALRAARPAGARKAEPSRVPAAPLA